MENSFEAKCSKKNHEKIEAKFYCQKCDINMCNKCQNFHSELYNTTHHIYNIDKNINEIFTGFCKENYHNKELNYFCKDHNLLCCGMCLCKIGDKGNGIHRNCNACIINDIQEEKRNKLSKNIKWLEDLSKNLEKLINEQESILENINENKEKLKKNVQEIFTKLRNEINKREDELLIDIDEQFQKLFFNENLVKEAVKLPKKIKESLEKGKILEKEWDKNSLCSSINDCINIENNIKLINELNKRINKCKQNENIKLFIDLKEEEINNIVNKIKSFGSIEDDSEYKFEFIEGLNYTLSNNGLIATKTSGGDSWNCTITGNKEIPKNKISNWKIRLNNFQIKSNTWNVLIGIGPKNKKNKTCFYDSCWTFICGESMLSLKSGGESKYNNIERRKLQKGDIVEVIVDRMKGTLSFSVNDKNYGLTSVNIPENEELYPIVMIYDENQIVEIV